MLRTLAATAAAAMVIAAPSSALGQERAEQCRAMAATFEAKQAEVLALQEAQATLAAEAEALGAAWEVQEEQRLFSPAHAEAADAARAAFEAKRSEAMRAAMDLRSKAQMLNTDTAQFNARCAGD